MTTDKDQNCIKFIIESNLIEGIDRDPAADEISEFHRFMDLDEVRLEDLVHYVSVYQPGAKLRNKFGMDVRVGRHYIPPCGGPDIEDGLACILADANCDDEDPYIIHHRFETLHPFMDGNGRCGRMLWAWQVRDFSIGFLHRFYYQALSHGI